MTQLQIRSSALSWREIDDELIAIDVRTSTYLSANRTGLLLWRELVDGTTREILVDRLVEAYGIAPSDAEADVDEFLETLRRRDLLEG